MAKFDTARLAPLNAPTFTGDARAVTPTAGDADTSVATTAFVATAVGAGGYQPLDATLTAFAAYNTNGLLTQTAADTFAGRSIAVPAAGISITNANGVSGNPTLALANDLAALEGLSGTNNIYYRSGADTWSAVTFSGLTFSGGVLTAAAGGNVSNSGTPTVGQYGKWVTATTIQGVAAATVLSDIGALSTSVAASTYQPLDADLTAIAALGGTNTIYYRSAANTWSPVVVSTGLAFSGGNLTATGSGGNVSNSGTPAANDVAQWVTSTTIKGVPLATWRTSANFLASTTFRNTAGGDGLNINGAANQGQIVAEGASADIGLVFTSKGNAAITMYNASFVRMCASFQSAPSSNTFATFTANVNNSTLANNPAGNPIVMGSDLQLTTGSTAITQAATDNSTKIATTAFVKAQPWASTAGRLEYVSAITLKFAPYNGNQIKINGTLQIIPNAGIAGLTNGGLSASTTYYVYAYMNGSVVSAEFSATGHTTSTAADNEGVEIKSGDNTRTLIGLVRTNASSQFQNDMSNRFVISWFNRRTIGVSGPSSAGVTSTVTALTELSSNYRGNFLSWGEEGIVVTLGGFSSNSSVNVTQYAAIGLNASTQMLGSSASYSTAAAGAFYWQAHGCTGGAVVAEGFNYITMLFGMASGTATVYVNVTTSIRG